LLDLFNHLCVDLSVADSLHHGQMLEVIVRLEKRIACEKFHDDAANTPNIAGKAPPQLKDDLWCSVMSG
jgi:hypothetical protein